MLVNNSKHRSETTSTEFRQLEFHRCYICFHSVDLSTPYKEVYAYKGVDLNNMGASHKVHTVHHKVYTSHHKVYISHHKLNT